VCSTVLSEIAFPLNTAVTKCTPHYEQGSRPPLSGAGKLSGLNNDNQQEKEANLR
jgi:hypothetical protein